MTGAMRILLGGLLAAALSACAARPPAASTPQQLGEEGQRQLARARPGPELDPPPGLDAQRVTPGDPDRARMPVDEALRHFVPDRPAAQSTDVSDEDHREALKRYAAGRALLRDGDAGSAARELAAATAIDPGAGEAWILRAEAELASGQRSAGTRSLRRGVALGAGRAVHRELLAREAMERRDHESAAALLAEARLMDAASESAELGLIIDAQLGAALEALGYDVAARELLLGVVPALADAAPAGRFAPLMASAIRQQARYWALIGDLSCRLGDYAGAFEAYRQAARAPGGDAAALADARIYAALRAGAPSHAAAIALEAIDEAGQVEGAGAALLTYVARAEERAGAALRRALASRLEDAEADESVRANLAMALAALQPEAEARRTLLRAHAASPNSTELIRAVSRSAGEAGPEEAARLGAGMVRAAPMRSAVIAWAIVRAHRDTDAIIASATGSVDPAARLLGARALGLAGRPGEGLRAIAQLDDPQLGPAVTVARAQLGAAAGDWGAVERAIREVEDAQGPEGRRAHSLALAAAQRYGAALEVIAPLVEEPDPPPGAMVEASWLALGLGQRALALRWLERAIGADPRDEAAHELRVRALTETASDESRARAARAVADFRRMMPGSATLELLEAHALASQGRLREAQTKLLALAEDPLRADEALSAVEDVWAGSHRRDAELLEEARQWLAGRAGDRPQSPATARALATALVALERPEDAAEALREAHRRYPWPELAVALEGVLREALDRPDEADRLALERLGSGPAGVDELLELAALRARRGELGEAAAAVGRIPAPLDLTDDQIQRLMEATRRAADAADRTPDASFGDATAIFDEAERLEVDMPADFHQRRLALLTAWEGADPDRIARAMLHASAQLGDGAGNLPAAVAMSLQQVGRSADALAIFDALAASGDGLPAGALDAWLILVARAGDAADARRLIEAGRRTGGLCEVLRRRQADLEPGASELDCASVVIALLASGWGAEGRADDVVEIYRLAYDLNPDDPGAANDLGYTLLEARRELGEAERLIEFAHEGEPDSGHVLDSIGWLRYRQGVFEDERGPDGQIIREGAVTLLERAAATTRGQVSATIQDHLGDALWRVGRRAAARLAWQTARSLAGGQPGDQAAEISRKLRDALRGEEPQVAPVYDDWAAESGSAGP